MENKNLEEKYSIPEEWKNYGDVNPKPHGGMFVRWDNGMWHIIETTNKHDLPEGMQEHGHVFEHMYMEPMDIWVNGNPEEGFTDRIVKELDSFSNLPFQILNPEDIPEGETYEEYVSWYMDKYFSSLLGNLVYIMTMYLHGDPLEQSNDYWGYLEKKGINQEDF